MSIDRGTRDSVIAADGLDANTRNMLLNLDEADTDTNLKKTRHFYPLLVELGLERLEGLEVTEVTERLEE